MTGMGSRTCAAAVAAPTTSQHAARANSQDLKIIVALTHPKAAVPNPLASLPLPIEQHGPGDIRGSICAGCGGTDTSSDRRGFLWSDPRRTSFSRVFKDVASRRDSKGRTRPRSLLGWSDGMVRARHSPLVAIEIKAARGT